MEKNHSFELQICKQAQVASILTSKREIQLGVLLRLVIIYLCSFKSFFSFTHNGVSHSLGFVQVMATDDIRLSIKESDDSKMCTRSSNKIGLQISPPSNLNPHIKIEVKTKIPMNKK